MNKNDIFADLTPVKNISGGSGAATWVVKSNDNSLFVRKFAPDEAGKRLQAQTQWLREFKSRVYCPDVLADGQIGPFYFYDMSYVSPSETGFQKLINDNSVSTSHYINLALAEFNLIFDHLTPVQNTTNRAHYIQSKFYQNLETSIKNDPAFAAYARAAEVNINGKKYRGLNQLLNHSAVQNTIAAIKNECLYSLGHGDLTLSNLLVQDEEVAFIDPNPNFELISPAQEYSKVLQSTIVKYELFDDMKFSTDGENSFTYEHGAIRDFSETNAIILKGDAFKGLAISNLFVHLCIHLARILPYIKPANRNKSYVYLAEIIKLLDAVTKEDYRLN